MKTILPMSPLETGTRRVAGAAYHWHRVDGRLHIVSRPAEGCWCADEEAT